MQKNIRNEGYVMSASCMHTKKEINKNLPRWPHERCCLLLQDKVDSCAHHYLLWTVEYGVSRYPLCTFLYFLCFSIPSCTFVVLSSLSLVTNPCLLGPCERVWGSTRVCSSLKIKKEDSIPVARLGGTKCPPFTTRFRVCNKDYY